MSSKMLKCIFECTQVFVNMIIISAALRIVLVEMHLITWVVPFSVGKDCSVSRLKLRINNV